MNTEIITLNEARDWLKSKMRDGTHCPCCRQKVKIYKRKLNSAMAVCLIELYKNCHNCTDFAHIRDLILSSKTFAINMNGGNFATLAYWDVIAEKPKEQNRTNSRTSGFWSITELGRAFVERKTKIPKYVYTYNMGLVSMEYNDKIGINEALGDKFNYEQLMRA